MNCKTDIVIIGASGGIGQMLVEYYRNKFCTVYGTFNTHDEYLIKGINVHYFPLDVESRFEMCYFVEVIKKFLVKPILIYTPAISIDNLVHNYKEDDWNHTLNINLTGAMILTSKFIPIMRELKFGRIIYLSSILSRIAVEGTLAYTVTKASLNAMAKVVAKENTKYNITANSLVLGYHDVGIIKKVPEKYMQEKVLPNIPAGHLGDSKNIINAIEFITRSDFVSGASIDVTGGM